MRKGFIGMGVMGFPMAGHLSLNGFDVCIFNRSQEKASNWVTQFNGIMCNSPSDMASQCDIIILCVGKDEDVKDVICGENGILKSIKPGTIIIDHTTTSATLSKDMNQFLQDKKAYFLDAPISGGQAGAEEGKLSIRRSAQRPSIHRHHRHAQHPADPAALHQKPASATIPIPPSPDSAAPHRCKYRPARASSC